jgi:hypothetical protein
MNGQARVVVGVLREVAAGASRRWDQGVLWPLATDPESSAHSPPAFKATLARGGRL